MPRTDYMKIKAVNIHRFRIPFIVPISVGGRVLGVREGFILAVSGDDGSTAYGEIAPLAGLDEVSLDQCRRDFPSLHDHLTGAVLDFDRFEVTAPLLGIVSLPENKFPPWTNHTWFGVECALAGLLLQQDSPATHFSCPLGVPVNGLFIPDRTRQNVNFQISKLKEQKVRTVKVKIGRIAPDEEISQIRDLADQLGAPVAFRFDGNRSLTLEIYKHYYDALHHLNAEYAEEPLHGGDWAAAQTVPWPIALDESLAGLLDQCWPRPSLISPAVNTIILKPGLLAGLYAMARCVTDAGLAGIKTVLSSSFNTGVGLAGLAIFCRLAGLPPSIAHGLDTLRYLAADVLDDSPVIREGKLVIPESFTCGGQGLNAAVIRSEEP
jgi:o-succinylbenzoate synthase